MLHGHTVSVAGLKNRLNNRRRVPTQRVVSQQENQNRLMEEIMAAHNVDGEYLMDLDALTKRIATDQTRRLLETKDDKYISCSAFYQPGRVYDQILVNFIQSDFKPTGLTVMYFVQRATGNIYGPKSVTAPNLKWFYGTLKTQDAWDWSGEQPVPTDLEKAGVREARRYGNFVHYEPVTAGSGTPPAVRAPAGAPKRRLARPRPRPAGV